MVGGITVKMTLYSNVRRRICTFAMGLGFAVGATQSGEAQTQNVAQQRMAQSLIALCQTPNLNPTGLGNLCAGLTALANTPGQQAALNVALQQLNGGAELLNPISQPSLLETMQPSQQTGVVEARLSRQREWMLASAAADREFLRTGQVAALNPQEQGGQLRLAQNLAPEVTYSTGPFGVFATGLGQFGSRDLTTSQNGYSFNNAGFVAGADYRLTPRMVAGLAFGYTHTNTSFDTSALSLPGQFLHDNTFTGNVYTTVAFTDALYLNAIALVGGGNTNSQRRHRDTFYQYGGDAG